MHRPEPLAIVGIDIRSLVRPDAKNIEKRRRASFIARCSALEAVAGGTAPTRAAELYGLDPRTVEDDAKLAMTPHDDGTLTGFRACRPFRRKRVAPTGFREVHHKPGAHSMTRLIASDARIGKLVEGFRGALPNGHRKNRRFDRFMGEFHALVRDIHGADLFLFEKADKGRRALLDYLKNQRKVAIDNAPPDETETPSTAKRLSQIVREEPLDRVEFDAHKEDVDWILRIPTPDGRVAERKIERITLVAAVCAASRYLLAYVLVLGEYNRLDVLRLVHRMMRPWQPRSLIVPGLNYAPGARIGLLPDATGALPRALSLAGDNARQHHARIVVDNLLHRHRGLYQLGPAYVPEVRAFVETFFAMIEKGALRLLPGAFQPSRTGDGPTRTSYARATDHPLQWHGMLDLMDVIGANYNVTGHNGHGIYGRRPMDVLDEYLASRWVWWSGDPARDARAVTSTIIPRTVRGAGRVPYIEYEGAHYRSRKLAAARHMVGKQFNVEIDVEGVQEMVLLDAHGAPWSKLDAQPPWGSTPHDLHLRQQINRARNRGLFSIVGVEDAVKAYAEFARTGALDGTGSVSAFARADRQLEAAAQAQGLTTTSVTAPAPPPLVIEPRPDVGRPTGNGSRPIVVPAAYNPAPRHGRASFANLRR